MRSGWIAVLATMVALVGCADDGDDGVADRATTTTTTDPALSPPGTEVLAGLVVPDGAALLGAPVAIPVMYTVDDVPVRDPDVQLAVLVVTGDPFAAFDALAEQARALDVDLPGSAGSCLWDLPPEPDVGFRREPVAGPDLDEEVTGARCDAAATDGVASLQVVLDAGGGRPATVLVEARSVASVGDDPSAGPGRFGAAEQTRANRRAELGDTPEARADEPASFLAADDPVPAEASDRLPSSTPQLTDTDPGVPLLPTAFCRSETERGDLVVPEGARVVARPFREGVYSATGDAALLVTDDAEAAMQDLYDQAAGPGAEDGAGGFFGEPPAQVTLDDGATAWSASFGTSAGGDVCELVASADGTTIFVAVGRG